MAVVAAIGDAEILVDTGGFEMSFADHTDSIRWPVSYQSYVSLAQRQLASLFELWSELDGQGDVSNAFALKLCYINHDLVRLGCLAVDVAAIEAAGQRPVFNPATNPVFAYLWGVNESEAVEFARNDWPQGHRSDLLWEAKTVAKRTLRWIQGIKKGPEDRFDVISQNELLEQYLANTGKPARRLFAYLLHRPMPVTAPRAIAPLADVAAEKFMSIIEASLDGNRAFNDRVRRGALRVCHGHLGRAWDDLKHLRVRGFANRPADVLVSGTPKYIGRLLSLLHRERGGRVFRFAHGGERAFFDDAEWPANELLHCDRYHCYGRGDAENTRRRLEEDRVLHFGPDRPKFLGVGSPRHHAIYARGRRSGRTGDRRTILYLPNNYTGEALYLTPSFRANDVLYTEWQIWLLRTLDELGYRVITKAHPRETSRRIEMLSRLCHRVETGLFDLSRLDARCLLFDFAGTAFFDALASDRGVVLLDTGMRPFDPTVDVELGARVAIVPTHFDERNLFRIAPEALRAGIEAALDSGGCTPAFHEKYFCADLAA